MAKGKDFYGKDVTEVISKACKELSVSQGDLDIEVLETGSAGIFGLCKKKAHIRVTLKSEPGAAQSEKPQEADIVGQKGKAESGEPVEGQAKKADGADQKVAKAKSGKKTQTSATQKKQQKSAGQGGKAVASKEAPPSERELPSDEVVATVRDDIVQFVEKMGFPSEVQVDIVDYSLECRISGEHEDALIGQDGRTLDSLQYLLRKMMSRRLPDRMMLTLDVGNYREQRAIELKERALELAEQVKDDGKTQVIPALNPSERRVVHMILQEDKTIRSRSVGEGLFKKVLIYKPGKKKKSGSRKGKGRQGGRSSGNR